MSTTLKIKNETGAELKIETGGLPIKLAKDAEADLSEKQLKSPGLGKAVETGSISFGKINKTEKAQVKLANEILGPLVKNAGGRLGTSKSRFEQSQKELLNLRDNFNKTWKTAETNLAWAQEMATVWKNVEKAVKNCRDALKSEDSQLTDKRKEEEAIRKKIDDLKGKNLPAPEMGKWLSDLQKEIAALNRIQGEIKKMEITMGGLEKEIEDASKAATDVTSLKKEKVIGPEIAEFGTP